MVRKERLSFSAASERDGSLLFSILFATFVIAFFGGGEPKAGINLFLMLTAGLFLTYTLVSRKSFEALGRLPYYARIVIFFPLILPLFQLIPFPYQIWQILPGQDIKMQVLDLIGIKNTWQSLSLLPKDALYSATIGTVYSIFFLALLDVNRRTFDLVIISLISSTFIGILIGAFQFSGTVPAFKFYKNIHTNTLIGFFANKNHMGLIIGVTILLCKYIAETIFENKFKFAHYCIIVFLIIAVFATNSRAGIALTLLAASLSIGKDFSGFSRKWIFAGMLVAVITFFYISSSSTFDIVYQRVDDVGEDGRWNFVVNSLPLIKEYFVVGAGYGSFASVYIIRESVDALSPVYTNHLHNDYLQLLIEGGMPAVAAFAVMVYSVGAGSKAGLARSDMRTSVWLGLSISLLFSLHSLVDYPLRRPAAAVYFMVGLICLLRPLLAEDSIKPRADKSAQTP